MRSLKSVWVALAAILLFSCTLSAKTEKRDADNSAQGKVITLTKADFLDKVFNYEKNSETWLYEGDKPCIIDFYADWCAPCKKVAPILAELAEQYKEDIVVYKINVDKEKELTAAFGIQAMPTFLFIPKEGIPQMAQGAMPRKEFERLIKSYLLGE